MAEDTTAKITEKPKEDKSTTLARRINAWGFIILVGLVFLVFGPIAAFLSWKSNTVEGTNVALKVVFAILAYLGNMFYIIWFAIMKILHAPSALPLTTFDSSFTSLTSSPTLSASSPDSMATPNASDSSPPSTFSSLFSSSSKPAPASTPVSTLASSPTSAPAPAPDPIVDDDMFYAKPTAKPAAQQGGKKKSKLRHRK